MARKRRKRPHGSIMQRGASWWIRWRENGRRRSESYPDKETAERVLAKILGDIAAGRGGLEIERPPSAPLSKLGEEWLSRREKTHRAHRDDANRWQKHVAPHFGRMLPAEVTVADLRRFVEDRIAAGLAPASVKLCVALLSSLFTDLTERGIVAQNPVRALPRAVRRLMRPTGAFSPFLEKQDDVRRLYLALPAPFSAMFAVGVLAGLRPGEVLALRWEDVDVDARRIVVARQARNGREGPPKSGRARIVPVAPQLAKILGEWKLRTGGCGQLFAPENPKRGGRPGHPPRFINLHSAWKALRKALKGCGLPESLTWYACTRHTFAAHFVLNGGSLVALREVLGHSSVAVSERYGRLRVDHLAPAALPSLSVDLSVPGGELIDMAAHRENGAGGFTMGSTPVDETQDNGVTTDGDSHRAHSSAGRAADF